MKLPIYLFSDPTVQFIYEMGRKLFGRQTGSELAQTDGKIHDSECGNKSHVNVLNDYKENEE